MRLLISASALFRSLISRAAAKTLDTRLPASSLYNRAALSEHIVGRDLSIPAADLEFIIAHESLIEHLLIACACLFRFGEVIGKVSADQFRTWVPGNLLRCGIDVAYLTLLINRDERVKTRFDQAPVINACQPQGLFGALAFRDIDRGAHHSTTSPASFRTGCRIV